MSTSKAEFESLLKTLPEDCSLEDVQYHLYILEEVKASMERAERRCPHARIEVMERLGKWASE